MARRGFSTLAVSLVVAVMVGVRESTGLAPPPPTLMTEEIEWLSPERPDAGGFYVVYEDPEPMESEGAAPPPRVRTGRLGRWMRALAPRLRLPGSGGR